MRLIRQLAHDRAEQRNRLIDRRRLLCTAIVTATTGGLLWPRRAIANESRPAGQLISWLSSALWAAQQTDGRWSSAQYGLLRSGQALTPFVLLALLDADELHTSENNHAHDPGVSAASEWIRGQLRRGRLGIADPDVLEYPVYASALALQCLLRTECSQPEIGGEIDALADFLLAEQFDESRGFEREDLAYGGWGFGGEYPPGRTGHMDLAHTRHALEALAAAGVDPSHFRLPAESFLGLVQKHPADFRLQPGNDTASDVKRLTPNGTCYDGGFYFSPIVLEANKGRLQRGTVHRCFRSYATATCDGVLALLAAGVPTADERLQSATGWLLAHPDWEYPAGIPRDYPEPWGAAVYFYHQAVRARAYRALRIDGEWPEQLVERIGSHVRVDHLVVNRQSALMKEDDPTLCTTLALMALTEAGAAIEERVS